MVTIQPETGNPVTEEILAGASLLVSEGQVVKAGEIISVTTQHQKIQ